MKYLRRTSRTPKTSGEHKTASLIAAAAAVAVPVLAATGGAVADWLVHSDREQRRAPNPGTFHTQLGDSDLTIYTSGAARYEAMIDAIDAAQQTVSMDAYIWNADEVGQHFVTACRAAAARGVTVHVLSDGCAYLLVPRSFYRQRAEKARLVLLVVIGMR